MWRTAGSIASQTAGAYEKTGRSFLALNHLAAAILAFKKMKENIIYG
jgi:hypothetical protein